MAFLMCEAAEFSRERFMIRQAETECTECGKYIRSLEKYKFVTGKWEGRFESFKMCMNCVAVQHFLVSNNSLSPFPFYYGALDESIDEYLDNDDFKPGQCFAFLRLVVKRNKGAENE